MLCCLLIDGRFPYSLIWLVMPDELSDTLYNSMQAPALKVMELSLPCE